MIEPTSEAVSLDEYLKLLRENEELKLLIERMKSTPSKMRRVFDYYGAKWFAADWIVSHFPVHEVYVEPFFGSGGVFFTKQPSDIEIVSDLYGEVVGFFNMLRINPDGLIREIMLTPYAESEYHQSFSLSGVDDMERARRFYVRMRMSWNGGGVKKTFRRDKTNARSESLPTIFRLIGSLYQVAARLQNAQIDCADAFEQVERYDSATTLFYIDPPYVASTRGSSEGYVFEMTDIEHERLSEVLHACKGAVILSGYESILYQKLYSDWRREDKRVRDGLANQQKECLWISPRAQQNALQPRLF